MTNMSLWIRMAGWLVFAIGFAICFTADNSEISSVRMIGIVVALLGLLVTSFGNVFGWYQRSSFRKKNREKDEEGK